MADKRHHDADDQQPDGDFGDFLSVLRVLLPAAQTLTAFLIILPFNGGFSQIQQGEKLIYVATFLCSICALILFSTPPPSIACNVRSRIARSSRTTRRD